ncbi:hypothetical protein ACFY00_15470 [Kitasatospora sp. NPDC001540]|uniref:hypothetical protein n=1 Tax=Kitasatospora sp. NPDC001540 TaxID=3364014 RepID=UPI00369B2D35
MNVDRSPLGQPLFSSSAVDEPVAPDSLPRRPVESSPFLEPAPAPAAAATVSSNGRRPLGHGYLASQT